jgi:cytochrome c oxidase assembly protein subunit 15
MNYSRRFIYFSWLTLIFIYLVVVAGSFVRITGSGMGCPDWPKCFGQWVPPTEISQLPENYKEIYLEKREKKLEKFCSFLNSLGMEETATRIKNDPTVFQEEDFNASKTWTEYLNRLVGALAGLFMFVGFVWMFLYYRSRTLLLLTGLNLILMGVEGWFGSIVVATNLVPWTITVHLFLALIIIGVQLFIVHKISPVQRKKLDLTPLLKWLTVIVFSITFYQMFLGTQVREYIDELTKQGFGRETWTDRLGWEFLIHRSFSWLVLILMTVMMWKNEKGSKIVILRWAYIILAVELISGVLLAYADMPGLVQTSHLIFASLLFGILLMTIYRMRSNAL